MERWEYAAGYQSIDDSWVPSSEPGTYEKARTELDVMMCRLEDHDWSISPSVIRRSDRHPTWQLVNDHAAELLAEVLTDIALRFASNGNDIMQGKDLNRVIKHVAFGLRPTQTEEYGE